MKPFLSLAALALAIVCMWLGPLLLWHTAVPELRWLYLFISLSGVTIWLYDMVHSGWYMRIVSLATLALYLYYVWHVLDVTPAHIIR